MCPFVRIVRFFSLACTHHIYYSLFSSREGAFDWLLGRQAYNWSNPDAKTERFAREYSGMSLRGLIWTLPQGYVLEQLGFGWEYSLTGSVMPLLYFIGANTNTTHVHGHRLRELVDGTIAVSELIWGMWVWFVLIIACLSQSVRRARIWIYRRNPAVGFKPFSRFETVMYKSMNRPIIRACYESLVIVLTVIYSITVMFYSLVEQKDVRNKGQTFFGLFTSVLFLIFAQAWLWACRYNMCVRKRYAKQLRGRTRTNNAIYDGGGLPIAKGSDSPELSHALSVNSEELAHCEGLSNAARSTPPPSSTSSSPRRSRGPVLSWPYSHPDRMSPTEEQRQQVLDMSEYVYRPSRFNFITIWTKLEKYICMDIFIFARRTIGVISLICTIFSLMVTCTALIIGGSNVRFRQDLDPPCADDLNSLMPW